jgi:Domain of unknown function (DUF4249)
MKKLLFLIIPIILCIKCTEPYALQTNNFEDVIVIEATLTNEFKQHEIKISKSFKLEENNPKFESGAIVYIKDNLGNQYNFSQTANAYKSDIAFQAISNRSYQLFVTTQAGKSYTSRPETLTTVSPLQELVPEVIVKEGVKGVQLVAKSFDPTKTSKYYRYEYEETYKVIAPRWINLKANAVRFTNSTSFIPGFIELIPRTEEAKVCYSTKNSTDIILTGTADLSEDKVSFPVRFISNLNYIIMNRYSILVKQYVENLTSYSYYQTLKKISNSENLLSPNQPGFIPSNIISNTNNNEKVIGFFSVSSFSEKRIFFNFEDLFPTDTRPEYPYKCPYPIPIIPDLPLNPEYEYIYCFGGPDCNGNIVFNNIISKKNVYYEGYTGIGTIPSGGPLSTAPTLTLYPIQCGDCTSFSNNIRPSFWID